MKDPYISLIPLMELKSALRDVRAFHQIVNTTFHDNEAKCYDAIHGHMWKSLTAPMHKLASRLLESAPCAGLKMLDIGCGTGLASELLLKTPLGRLVEAVTLLDTSSVMLAHAGKRSRNWGKPTVLIEGEINDVRQTFDLIIISSVLHHIPDLENFLACVTSCLNEQGLLLTIHDPLHEAVNSQIYRERSGEYQRYLAKRRKNLLFKAYYAAKRRLASPESTDYITHTNTTLLRKGAIHTPLTEVELWSVTDIHVEELPFSNRRGISIQLLKDNLELLELLDHITYSFFGPMESELTAAFRKRERFLQAQSDRSGRNFGSVWKKMVTIPGIAGQ